MIFANNIQRLTKYSKVAKKTEAEETHKPANDQNPQLQVIIPTLSAFAAINANHKLFFTLF